MNYKKLSNEAVTSSVAKTDNLILNVNGSIKQATIDNVVNSSSLASQITSPFNFKGDVTYANLPTTGNTVNDTYYVTDKGCNYTWNGSSWYQSSTDNKSDIIDLKIDVKYLNYQLTLENGYVQTSGAVVTDTTGKYKYSNYLAVSKGDDLVIDINHSESCKSWCTVAIYDKYKVFSERVILINATFKDTSLTYHAEDDGYVIISISAYDMTETIKVRRIPNFNLEADRFNDVIRSTAYLAPLILGGKGDTDPKNYVIIDTINHTMTFPDDTLIISEKFSKGYKQISPVGSPLTLDLTQVDNSTTVKIVYNLTTNTINLIRFNVVINTENEILLAVLRKKNPGDLYEYAVSINAPYKLNNAPYGVVPTKTYNNNLKVVNHRGFNTIAPENTMSAFKLSKEMGFTYVETDVQFTSDSIPVLLHDATVDRTSNGSGNIKSMTFAEVRALDFGSWKNSKYTGEKIPSFEEFISYCKYSGLHPYIEIKSTVSYTDAELESLVYLVKKYGMVGKVTWISFSANYLNTILRHDTNARVGFLLKTVTSSDISTFNSITTTNKYIGLNKSATDAMINLCLDAGIALEVWTIDTKEALEALNPYYSGITSNVLTPDQMIIEN